MISQLAEVRDYQLQSWDLARENYEKLGNTARRTFHVAALNGAIQFNPARAVSTGAKIDVESIKKRPCFLCAANRPSEQLSEEIVTGWDFLVNPYPIFPLHFTIASRLHTPQDKIPLEMASMAEKLPGMTVFFNGARAGASAPDHLHCQAVMTDELPLMRYLEDGGDCSKLPFKVDYRIITPNFSGMALLAGMADIQGIDRVTGKYDSGLVNAFVWLGNDGILRTCVVPRTAHRPSVYTTDGNAGFMVSPGAIDMAGIIILPRKTDFDNITSDDVKRIYNEVSLPSI